MSFAVKECCCENNLVLLSFVLREIVIGLEVRSALAHMNNLVSVFRENMFKNTEQRSRLA